MMNSTADGSIEDAMAVYYTYNGYGELTEVETDSGLSAVYTYDVTGCRQSKTVNGETTRHIWDGDNMVYETDGGGAAKAKYYRASKLIAQKTGTATSYYN
ncbi:hypothetical protein [Ructibacterium gallinarum]|uniref:Uncharacterized protein n=1 Tax=Ructibacterium gallinarum TaxID=2779355 RepID=A0A9D5M7Q7_9FIRM|nr:hypothetical protein [Ructibacterium gallinarum]MBE5041102.1 hypothetical protein [Ructibacterium gallinarum]